MARTIKPRKSRISIVVIADGEDEKWYLEKVREYYHPDILRRISIKPDLVQKKKVTQLFEEAENKVKEGVSYVLLIIDFDELLKNNSELEKFKNLYGKYLDVTSAPVKKNKKYAWMERLKVIVNNPCLEYWYLLHFRKTNKFYPNFLSLKPDLTAIPNLRDYDKNENYYKRTPDIYMRLGGEEKLICARRNATPFQLHQCQNTGGSEMNLLFDFFDEVAESI